MDTKFSVAVHVLDLLSESLQPTDSERMARSVGTNASYILKVLGLLKRRVPSGKITSYFCNL